VVRIGAGHPELQAALAGVPARARAERLRQLALVGLYSLRAGPPTPAEQDMPKADGLDARRARLLRGLLDDAD
jgi:hypothetical protein